MGLDERIAAVAEKLSRLKSRHNDNQAEIAELEQELKDLKSGRAKITPAPAAARRTRAGYADEDDDDEEVDDELEDDDDAAGEDEDGTVAVGDDETPAEGDEA